MNQIIIFMPVLLVPILRRHEWASAWIRWDGMAARFAIGFGLALIALLLYSTLESGSPSWAESVRGATRPNACPSRSRCSERISLSRFCHGVPSSRVEARLIFDEAVAVELGVRLIVPDRPGVGQSDFQPGRQIMDWPNDVVDLVKALDIDRFAVLGSSGGAPYAAACAVRLPSRVLVVGLLGGVAPLDNPTLFQAMNGPFRLMTRLARFAPAALRLLFRLNLRALRGSADRASERVLAVLPEPDRTLMRRPDIRNGFSACFVEACRRGPRGPVWDMSLLARPWGFDPSTIMIPARLWHGELDRNVPVAHGRYLASRIPTCQASFYPGEAHLSLPLNHQREILRALVE